MPIPTSCVTENEVSALANAEAASAAPPLLPLRTLGRSKNKWNQKASYKI